MNELGVLLEKLRGKKTLREVADKTGLSHTYIRDLELGVRRATGKPIKPSPHVLNKLARYYNYSFEELMKVAGYQDILRDYDHEGRKKHDLYKILTSESEVALWKGTILSDSQRKEVINIVDYVLK